LVDRSGYRIRGRFHTVDGKPTLARLDEKVMGTSFQRTGLNQLERGDRTLMPAHDLSKYRLNVIGDGCSTLPVSVIGIESGVIE
jgi:hypothetical protein